MSTLGAIRIDLLHAVEAIPSERGIRPSLASQAPARMRRVSPLPRACEVARDTTIDDKP